MLDHISIYVNDLEKSKAFYEKVLAVLGYTENLTNDEHSFYGFGIGDDPIFEIVQSTSENPAHQNVHVAFKAESTEQIDEFHKIALENGATDNGKPGPRPEYTPTYYAAFIIDPDGNNIELCLY